MKILVKDFLRTIKGTIHILMLQELKAYDFRLTTALNTILPSYNYIISQSEQGRGGSALLIHNNFTIIRFDTFCSRLVVWAHIRGKLGIFKVAFIYGPSHSTDRTTL